MKRAGWLVLGVLWLHQVAIALLSPLSERDWSVAIDGPIGPTLGAVFHWLIVRSQLAHVALTPLAVVALPLGLATLARGRRLLLVRSVDHAADHAADHANDVLLLAVLASALWLAAPLFGLACSFRYATATFVAPLAAAVWYVAGFRAAATRIAAGIALRPRWLAALAAGGVVAGASTPPVATMTLVICALIARRTMHAVPDRRAGDPPAGTSASPGLGGLWAGLAGLAIGAALAWLTERTPLREHLAMHDVQGELRAFSTQLRVCGWVGAGTAMWCLLHAARRRLLDLPAAPLPVAALDVVIRAIAIACATAVLGLATADFGSFQALASGAAVATLAATVTVALARSRRARIAMVVLAAAVQAKMISGSLRTLAAAHRESAARLAILTTAPRGSIATVAPYPRRSKEWFFGEDFRTSQRRDRVATLGFGLRGIALLPERRDTQHVPQLALRHEVEGGAAGLPDFYSADLTTAREQFAAAVTRGPGAARLIADGLAVPDRPGAPVLAAWRDGDRAPAWWKLDPRPLDREGQLRVVPIGAGLAGDDTAPEVLAMWSFDLATGAAEPLARGDDGGYRLRPGRRMNAGLVACTRDRCALCEVVGLF